MSNLDWVIVGSVWCERLQQQAELLEQRLYPAEILPSAGAGYQVRARKCSHDIECNLSGYTCRWAFNNPNFDPFA
jgi:hypothetical protein